MKTWTLAKKDLKILFSSPLAYIVLACFLFISGYFFLSLVAQYQLFSLQAMQMQGIENFTPQEWIIRPYLQNSGVILLFFIPLITMRAFSEEKKLGTFELLLSYPVKEYQIVLGKLMAVGIFIFVALVLNGVGPALLFVYSQPEFLSTLAGYSGLFLLAIGFVSLGLFLSSLTENQIISACLSFGALLILWLLAWIKDIVPKSYQALVNSCSLLTHFESFAKGVISGVDLIYFLSFIIAFIGLTLISLENQRWRV
ncbi:ABC-2 type transport system permease protein [Desulfonauticus submarinus]|uniref:ABC-2 type transport system permease protein n=1 Tax=Desulfonauticus submarinus TaxID=206665 RepID=A0A1H0B5C8_9BACT|nr:ABC transporter permease subunit [Desulfonauticus submarinus]SDN40857.1 ABC-2 type transport system permease protein [Desulfonauticus submarinus]